MKKVGIGIDYSNICKDYNTAYLDRDNNDPATTKCIKQVVAWSNKFLSELLDEFDYKLNKLNSSSSVEVDEVASNRFLFYSLEKEITIQSYVAQEKAKEFESIASWEEKADSGFLIKNDEDGEGIYLFFNDGSKEQEWAIDRLKEFSIDEVSFPSK